MAENLEFDIYLRGIPGGTEEEWQRAQQASASELAVLSSEDAWAAKKFSMSTEEWQRSGLAGEYAQQRLARSAKALGQTASEILSKLGPQYRLVAVVWESSKRWLLRIETEDNKVVSVGVPLELADDVLDSGAHQDIDRLRNLILFGIGRPQLIFKH